MRAVVSLYHLCLSFYPRHFQEAFAEEMEAVFQEQLEATVVNGRFTSNGRFSYR